jgi:hypothetical protein
MSAAFNMQIEIADLAERIVGPVAAKLAQKELDAAVDQIRNAFAQLNIERGTADEDFEAMAIAILEPVSATLSEADFARIVDRLRGAMVGFCQHDDLKAEPDAEPWGFNLSLLARSHGGVRQSKLCCCSSSYGSAPRLVGNCTDGGYREAMPAAVIADIYRAVEQLEADHRGRSYQP